MNKYYYFIGSFQHEINRNITFPPITPFELRSNLFLTCGIGANNNLWKIGCSKGNI